MINNSKDNKVFETKVTNLIAATRRLDIPQILMLRRLTLADPESRKWATERQLQLVFNVILGKACERTAPERLREARDQGFAPLVPAGSDENRAQDVAVLSAIVSEALGQTDLAAAEHEAALQKLLAIAPAPVRAPVARSIGPAKEPAPLFAAQLGMAADSEVLTGMLPDEAGGDPPTIYVDFPTLFDETLSRYSRTVLSIFKVDDPLRSEPLPFLLSPDFAQAYEEVIRQMIFPTMRASRHIQQLGMTYNWEEIGGAKLIEIIHGSEVNNPILHHWDSRWSAFRPGKGRELKPADNPWPLFRKFADRGGYAQPEEQHLTFLRDIIRFETDSFSKAWREISQLYEQELSPSGRQDQAREGAFRDGLMKWSSKLPDHIGEYFAIKAYFQFPRVDGTYLRRLLHNFGRTEVERQRNAPFLSAFVPTLSE